MSFRQLETIIEFYELSQTKDIIPFFTVANQLLLDDRSVDFPINFLDFVKKLCLATGFTLVV